MSQVAPNTRLPVPALFNSDLCGGWCPHRAALAFQVTVSADYAIIPLQSMFDSEV